MGLAVSNVPAKCDLKILRLETWLAGECDRRILRSCLNFSTAAGPGWEMQPQNSEARKSFCCCAVPGWCATAEFCGLKIFLNLELLCQMAQNSKFSAKSDSRYVGVLDQHLSNMWEISTISNFVETMREHPTLHTKMNSQGMQLDRVCRLPYPGIHKRRRTK